MSKSKIEWTDRTWNPVRGCSRVSEGCRNCYAERIAARFSKPKDSPFHQISVMTRNGPRWTGKVELIESKLTEPLHWKKPQRVFVNSMSDLFHEALPDEAIDRAFAVMALCPHITFQVLTKRPARMLQWFKGDGRPRWEDHVYNRAYLMSAKYQVGVPSRWPLPNVWLGVSVEDQAMADERIPLLLQTPAAIRFVSYEPALGPVDFSCIPWPMDFPLGTDDISDGFDSLRFDDRNSKARLAHLDWIIAGGESGPGARPPHPDWFRSARDQCQAAGVPFFFKQWGVWREPLDGEA
jgi:protein gp37